ncbi:MAG: hypothetical protein WC435_02720 [Candidatus Paceibacterota bacterium]
MDIKDSNISSIVSDKTPRITKNASEADILPTKKEIEDYEKLIHLFGVPSSFLEFGPKLF